MSGEKGLINRYVFKCNNPLASGNFDHPIDEQEGVAVGEESRDRQGVHIVKRNKQNSRESGGAYGIC